MLKLNGVTKTYISKDKQRVDALRGVSFELGNTGLVFILGKSGSGKSTLLNLLGGLDSPTDGEIVVDGVSMKDFTQADYDSYRNSHVGFIFQEFNLLDEFNVKDNIALALQLEKGENIDEKVTNALHQVELTDDYLTRRVSELSGGQKQRIAIARSIVKNSRMILADEPTGNLDSATGESIWNILKELSKKQLVVVVSHDRDSAEKYADRIIEIADGKVVSDNGQATETASDTFVAHKKSLPFKTLLKMSWNNLKQRKAKTVSVILLSVLSILALLIAQMCLSFISEKAIASFVMQNDVRYITVNQRTSGGRRKYVVKDTLDYINDHSMAIVNYNWCGLVEDDKQIEEFGLKFIGQHLPLDENSYYLFNQELEMMYENGEWLIEQDGNYVPLVKELHPVESVVGKSVCRKNYLDELEYPAIIAGVLDDDLGPLTSARHNFEMPTSFARSDFKGLRVSDHNMYNVDESFPEVQLNFNATYESGFEIRKKAVNEDNHHGGYNIRSYLLTENKELLNYEQLKALELADDEVILTYEFVAKLFDNVKSKWYVVNRDFTNVNDWMEDIVGKYYPLALKDQNGKTLIDLGEMRIVGVIFDPDMEMYSGSYEYERYQLYLSRQNMLNTDLITSPNTMVIKVDSVKNLSAFLTKLRKQDCNVSFSGYLYEKKGSDTKSSSEFIYSIEGDMSISAIICASICAVLTVMLILLVINMISLSISARKREIGILSALGTTNRDITNIFIFETLIIAAICFVLTLICTFVIAAILNATMSSLYIQSIPVFQVGLLTVGVLAVASFGLLLLATWIPVRKIAKMKPIDAIRNV